MGILSDEWHGFVHVAFELQPFLDLHYCHPSCHPDKTKKFDYQWTSEYSLTSEFYWFKRKTQNLLSPNFSLLRLSVVEILLLKVEAFLCLMP